ncbi:nucleotidyltransferase family protein [Magnetospirillum sp. UT-4]|uniref:nucleotidyltransferase family protein n=1 Tax=Magnetospirillum sp. UT-4 TaxID=2681467 RepID=UPI0013848026|nr:nucleotidyltransferase family protein [Magnetospirillum sp. UT-4]CAA7621671.1 putative mannose-1-phosphate guanyltransferase [Magnetospirillum sp. UT-4]
MTHWQSTLLSSSAPIAEAIRIIDESSKQICLVVDDQGRLQGTVTDGDIRRAILRSHPLDLPVERIMNRTPITARPDEDRAALLARMKARRVHQLPIVAADGRVVGLAVVDEMMQVDQRGLDNWVVLMAGGLGMRLRPLTEDTPKPLLKVGNRPLLEIALEELVRQGFRRFYVSVNYLGEKIKEALGDGARWDADIRYLDETKRMGTAGALSLIPEPPEAPVMVMNADLLTKLNLKSLLDYHHDHRAAATIAVRDYEFQVPYGVVRVDNQRIVGIDEKPRQHFFVNAGIYVLNPEVIARIPRDSFVDMPDVFDGLIRDGLPTAAFPLREYWLDIGRMNDFDQANRDVELEFPDR